MLKVSVVFFAVIVSLFASSCSDSSTEVQSIDSKLMVVHASPDAPAVDISVDNNKINTSALVFPNNSGYVSIAAGLRNVKVFPAGQTTTLFNVNLDIPQSKNFTVFAVDSASKLTLLLVEDLLPTVVSGKAHVRFLHLAPNAPAVDIAVKNGPTLFLGRSFDRQLSSMNNVFIPVDAGTYNLEVKPAGTQTVVLDLPNITLESGKAYTVFAKGFLGGEGAKALGAQIIVNR